MKYTEKQYHLEMAVWQEVHSLISKYDWAVENATKPDDTELSREQATELRNKLVELARTLAVKEIGDEM